MWKDLVKRREDSNAFLSIYRISASLPHLERCDVVSRIVSNSIAYLGYYELPSKSAFLILIYSSYLLNNAYTRLVFELDENE